MNARPLKLRAATKLLPLLLLFALPAVAQAQFNFTTNNDAITITRYTGPGGAVTIPSTTNGYPVTSIGTNAFEGTLVTSVIIPNSVVSIGEYAFNYCQDMTSITIGTNVTSIGDWAFSQCPFASVIIPSSVTSIGASAFNSCMNLTSVTIPDSVVSIGNSAFYGSALPSITIPGSVTNIGDGAFAFCWLTTITVDPTNASYSSVNGILFNKSQTTLIQYPILNSRTSYTIPDSVTSIGDYAFEENFALTSVTIPNGVTNIGDQAFALCRCVSFTVGAANAFYSSVNGVLFNKNQTTLIQYPVANAGTSYMITNSVTSIGDYAFAWCNNLTNITIPNSVTSIGDSAFWADNNLTSVTIPDSVTSIGIWAFQECPSLANVAIGNGVTNIGDYAFYDCSSLTRVTIGSSVTSIGGDAFYDCRSLTSFTIPDSVTSIGGGAFANCTSLTSVTIGSSVTSIGQEAFTDCTSLTKVYFRGNSPTPNNDLTVFYSDHAIIYYLPGTTVWASTFDGRLTALWFLPNPVILHNGAGFGVQPGGFGFTISWATNTSVVVEAATNLAIPVWIPVSTNTLTGGTSSFTDPQWTNYPGRYYRLRSP